MTLSVARLDIYNCTPFPGFIRFYMSSISDPELVDIMSDIDNNNRNIFLDGEYYIYTGNVDVYRVPGGAHMDVFVRKNSSYHR